MAKKVGILDEIMKEYSTAQGEAIPEHLKEELKNEASYELASKLPENFTPDPETVRELVEAWLIILSAKAKERGIRTQLSWARIRNRS